MGKLTDEELYCLVIVYEQPPDSKFWSAIASDTLREGLRERELLRIETVRRPLDGSKPVLGFYRITEQGEETLEELPANRIVSVCLARDLFRLAVPFVSRLELDKLAELLVHRDKGIRRAAEERYKQLTKCPRWDFWRRVYERMADRWWFRNRNNASKTS